MFAVKRYARGSTPVARPCHRRHLGRRRTLKVVSPTILVLVEVDGFNLLLILRGPLSAGHRALLLQASILKEPPVSLQAALSFCASYVSSQLSILWSDRCCSTRSPAGVTWLAHSEVSGGVRSSLMTKTDSEL
jgi:hypothetical protein